MCNDDRGTMNAELTHSSFRVPRSKLLRLFMISVFTATATELAELKPVRRGLLILGRDVIAALTVNTLKHNIIAWHFLKSCSLSLVLCTLLFKLAALQ